VETRVQRWGNSLAVRIPRAFARQAGLQENAPVMLTLLEGKLLIEPVVARRFTLEALLAGVTEQNAHAEVDFGSATGQEVW
jgi:antitoxin MazE